MNISLIRDVIQQSLAGTMTFPQIVGKLLAEDVESYHVDLIRSENRYYMQNGESYVETVPFSHPQAGRTFSATQVMAAIKAIQTEKITYQEFLHEIIAAGTVYYIAYLTGKKVVYLGREGDFHIEPFPNAK